MSHSNPQHASPTGDSRDSIILATVFGLLAAVGYTAANICLRAVTEQDPYWVSAMKAVPTVLIFGPWLLVRISKSQALLPPLTPFLWLIAAALVGQVGGNVVFQWSLGVIGIALAVPICLGMLIISGAWLGRVLLGEKVTLRNAGSMVLLIAAIVVLSLGAPKAHASLADVQTSEPLMVAAGVLAACLAGLSYGVLGVAIRNAARQGSPHTTTLVTVGLAGVLVLWPWTLLRIGWEGMLATDTTAMAFMIGAGLANAAAFFALTKSLQMANIVHVNALNATQATMAAVAGVLLFAEPLSAALGLGVLLTAGGLILMKGPVAVKSVEAGGSPAEATGKPPVAAAEKDRLAATP